jgi:hypothetical protein
MKLADFTSDVSKLGELTFLSLLNSSARNAHSLAKRSPIYKSIDSKSPFLLLDSSASNKKPKFFIDQLILDLPSWKRFPARGNSITGYTDRDLAEQRGDGDLFVLIPFDSAKIVQSSANAFSKSFEKAASLLQLPKLDNEGIQTWIDSIAKAATEAGHELRAPELTAYKQLTAFIKKLDELESSTKFIKTVKSLPGASVDEQRLLHLLDRRSSVLSYFDELLAPDNNGYSLLLPTTQTLAYGREVWVHGKMLAIKRDMYQILHDRGAIK